MSAIAQMLHPVAPRVIDPVCKLELRSVYGAWKVYPFCDTAKAFAAVDAEPILRTYADMAAKYGALVDYITISTVKRPGHSSWDPSRAVRMASTGCLMPRFSTS